MRWLLAAFALTLTFGSAAAAPQVYVIRGHWFDVRDAYLAAQVDAPFEGVFIYDPDARNITGDPAFGTLGNVDAGQTPATQQVYLFESRSDAFPGVLPTGPNGWNFLKSGGVYFPRATLNSEGEPHRPLTAKVWDDAPGPIPPDFWDVVSFADNLDLTQTGGGTHGVTLSFIDFTSNGQSHDSLDLPDTIDLDEFSPFQPWGITIRGNGGLVIPGGPTNDGIEQIPFGDANLDGRVTGADYTLWADHFGLNPDKAIWADGDFNVDGQVTGADYTIWADHFGQDFSDAPSSAVPEPGSLLLSALAALTAAFARRRIS